MKILGYIKLLLLSVVQISCVQSQTKSLEYLDRELAYTYDRFYENRHNYESRDAILKKFKKDLLSTLQSENVQNFQFDSLSKRILKIVTSSDQKLKILSWDQISGGTWHDYNAAYQFVDNKSIVDANFLKLNEGDFKSAIFTDAICYKVYYLEANKYLIESYGTHGSGHDFITFRLLNFDQSNKIKDISNSFDTKDIYIFEKPRSLDLKPIYSEKEKTITYPILKPHLLGGEETGFSEPTGKFATLVYKNGKFIKKNNY